MAQQTHFVTPDEAALMAVIDIIADNLTAEDVYRTLIDFDFLRDYTIVRLQLQLMKLGVRAYTAHACASVYASRYCYKNRHLSQLKYHKKV